jgi:hypothetical protein
LEGPILFHLRIIEPLDCINKLLVTFLAVFACRDLE